VGGEERGRKLRNGIPVKKAACGAKLRRKRLSDHPERKRNLAEFLMKRIVGGRR